jgi:hypothetical protein
MIKNHVRLGYDLLKDMEFPCRSRDYYQQSDERLDGSCYPRRGLKEAEIRIEARILAVAYVEEPCLLSSLRETLPGRQPLGEIRRKKAFNMTVGG